MQRWSIVCDRDKKFKSISQSIFFAGNFAGVLMVGIIADWFGRKTAFFLCLTGLFASSLASWAVDNPYAWMAIRFPVGAFFLASATAKNVYMVMNLLLSNF